MIVTDDMLDKLAELMEETVSYLHSWCCTKDGEYKPVAYRSVKMAVISLLGGYASADREESHNILKAFKNGVKNGDIALQIDCFGISNEYKSKLYHQHKQNIKLFEEKYNIENEEDKK